MMLPAKLQTYLACGAPILAAAGGESAELIQNARCGVAVEPELSALVSGAKKMMALSRQERADMSAAARQCHLGKFQMGPLVDRLIDMMEAEQ